MNPAQISVILFLLAKYLKLDTRTAVILVTVHYILHQL